jgi:hypothetical protein
VDVPLQSLLNLPDGAGYTARDGQASVLLQRHGDQITVSGRCDSIARQCRLYEHEVFRQRNELDSLKQVISRLESLSSQKDTTGLTEDSAFQDMKQKSSATWYKWLLAGILAGFAAGLRLTSPLRELKNKVLTFIKK